ncbi:DUF1345 domain-containing protein [Novosphingobium sp. G106]|uniref:DUF1345 domain-containing protein n=1 Tax=Novosphingobium sp. G106 TaxID=2849500 RepID=UPI001C2DA620|nr:DUF1345 domain-containing protein [Novosphingobium sp. G106]MBV1690243.1 DUF1345 domain-containing protein [Novosphingobium sp. G106]
MTARRPTVGNRLAPARFIGFLVVLVGGYLVSHWLLGNSDWKDAVALAFDLAAVCFLISLVPLLKHGTTAVMRLHAEENDANRLMVLVITSLLTLVVMVAVSGELDRVNKGDLLSAAKLVATLLLIWLFANSVYALHYAHAFYSHDPKTGGDSAGIDFPGTKTPSYSDFAYFAFTLGMTFQTSDVEISAPAIRQVALLHSFAAFIFNIGVIAFTINVLGGSG